MSRFNFTKEDHEFYADRAAKKEAGDELIRGDLGVEVKNKWGFPEYKNDGSMLMPPIKSGGIELYQVDESIGTFGARVVLDPRMKPEYYEGDKIRVCKMTTAISTMLRQVGLDDLCVEVVDLDGNKSECADLTVEALIKSMARSMAHGEARDQYEKEIEEGVLPANVDFDTWLELQSMDRSRLN